MRAQDTSQRATLYLSILRLLLIGTFADLGILVLVIFAHAATGSDILLRPAEGLTAALGLLAVSSLALGVVYAATSYPKHRRPVLFLVLITLGTMLAHAYIFGAPPASMPGTLTGAVGAPSLQDSQIQVQSSFHDQNLTVVVRSIGGNALGDLQVSAPGATLLSGGFSPQPTFASPLASGAATGGVWRVAGNASQITVSYQFLTCYAVSSGQYGCIMDEVYYVPEAMGLLAGQPCSTTIADGAHCHMEHPYLAPALIAAGMAVFGEFSSASWRIFPALLGTFSIPLVFGISWKLTTDKRLAYFAALFLALDVMFFSQSSAGLLDVPEVFFGLLALFAYLWDVRLWKFDRHVVAGVLLGLAGLSKETAVFIALGVLTYIFFFESGSRRQRVLSVAKVTFVLALVFAVGLQAYDSVLASPNAFAPGISNSCPGQTSLSSYPNFVDHIRYSLCYGSSLIAHYLECQGGPHSVGYWCKFPNDPGGPPILPTDWLIYYNPVDYYYALTSATVCPNSVNGTCQGGQYYSEYLLLVYYGITNLVVTWTVFVWVPLLGYVIYRHFRKPAKGLEAFGFGQPGEGPKVKSEVQFAGVTILWLAWNYLPYIFLFLDGRVTYPFYVVPAIPALAMGAAYFVTRKWFPKWLVLVYVGAAFIFFFVYYPDKAFLPVWLRVIIGH